VPQRDCRQAKEIAM